VRKCKALQSLYKIDLDSRKLRTGGQTTLKLRQSREHVKNSEKNGDCANAPGTGSLNGARHTLCSLSVDDVYISAK